MSTTTRPKAGAAPDNDPNGLEELVFPVDGMDCMDCARTLERGVSGLKGVETASVNFTAARMTVTYAPDATNREQINKRVSELGYRVGEEPAAGASAEERARVFGRGGLLRERQYQTMLAGALLTAGGIVADLAGAPGAVGQTAYLLAILIAGAPVARQGFRTLRVSRQLDINILMTIAIIGALAIDKWLEGATVVVLFALGDALEGYSADRARRSIRSLMSLAPAEAVVRGTDGERRVPVAQIAVGDLVIVRPGERIPMDGNIVAGQSVVNQAPVTGESIPVDKSAGEDVFAGTINGAGVLDVRVTRLASDSTIARIIRMVEEAQEQKAPTQRFVESFAAWYTPGVVVVAALMATVPPLFFGGAWSDWVYRSLVLLVVSCPCALVISTPVTIVSAIAAAARNGVLVKGGAYLEAAGSLRALALDKTGTLTMGTPEVTAVIPLNGMSEADVLRLAATVERYSEHPLGAAIVRAADLRGASPNGARVEDVRSVMGRGIEARVDGASVRVGTRALALNGNGANPDPAIEARLTELEERGQTAVLVAIDDAVVGVIGMADRIRPESRDAMRAIKAAGIRETIMLTGDRRAVAQAVAAEAGVDSVEAELLPDHKVDAIERLLARHGQVGMVGDGINDAPALARSTIGFAMGAAGTDTAMETADIALMSDDLSKLAFTVRLSRRAKRVIAANVTFSIGIKLVFLVLALVGTATLWEAVIADVGASIIVTANGLRMLRQR